MKGFEMQKRGLLVVAMAVMAASIGIACSEDGTSAIGRSKINRDANPAASVSPQHAKVEKLLVEDVVEGTGEEAKPGRQVKVHYTGWLYPNGETFDSSVGRSPFQFKLGAGQVIPGWDKGVAGMKEGGKRLLTIPSYMAYGERGVSPVIPPNATLSFEVELLEVEK